MSIPTHKKECSKLASLTPRRNETTVKEPEGCIFIPLSSCWESAELHKESIKNGLVKEIKLDTQKKEGTWKQTVAEWVLSFSRESGISKMEIHNKYSNNSAHFYTSHLQLFKQFKKVDYELCKGYAVQSPTDPSRTVLIFATKYDVNVYLLEKGAIKQIPVPINEIKIDKKPELLITFNEEDIGKYIGILALDENVAKQMMRKQKPDKDVYIKGVVIYPNPVNPPKDFDGYGVDLFKIAK